MPIHYTNVKGVCILLIPSKKYEDSTLGDGLYQAQQVTTGGNEDPDPDAPPGSILWGLNQWPIERRSGAKVALPLVWDNILLLDCLYSAAKNLAMREGLDSSGGVLWYQLGNQEYILRTAPLRDSLKGSSTQRRYHPQGKPKDSSALEDWNLLWPAAIPALKTPPPHFPRDLRAAWALGVVCGTRGLGGCILPQKRPCPS